MLKTLLILTIFIYSAYAQAACTNYKKIYGLVHIKQKSWETTHVNKKPIVICDEIPLHPTPNIEVQVSKDSKEFRTKVYRPLADFWDVPAKNESFAGGRMEIKYLHIDTIVPDWYEGAKFILRDLDTQKIIIETKL